MSTSHVAVPEYAKTAGVYPMADNVFLRLIYDRIVLLTKASSVKGFVGGKVL